MRLVRLVSPVCVQSCHYIHQCCGQDLVRLLDTNQWIESVELGSKLVSVLIELARLNPSSSPQWDGHIDHNV